MRSYDLHANAYVTKPVDFDAFARSSARSTSSSSQLCDCLHTDIPDLILDVQVIDQTGQSQRPPHDPRRSVDDETGVLRGSQLV